MLSLGRGVGPIGSNESMSQTKDKLSKKQILDRASQILESHFARLPVEEREQKRKAFEDFVTNENASDRKASRVRGTPQNRRQNRRAG